MYLAFDGEFGGLGLDKSLLTMYFGAFSEEGQPISELDLVMKPDDGVYKLTAKGMEINGIDIVENDKIAITYKEAGQALYKFLFNLADSSRELDEESKIIPVGHSCAGDIAHITDKLISGNTWANFLSYKAMDTAIISQFLRKKGTLPADLSCSLVSLTSYFGIKVEGVAHTAKYDALCSFKVYEELRKC